MQYEKASQAFLGVVLAARSLASTRMHVRKRKASYFNCNFMASLMFAVLVRPVANDARQYSTRFLHMGRAGLRPPT